MAIAAPPPPGPWPRRGDRPRQPPHRRPAGDLRTAIDRLARQEAPGFPLPDRGELWDLRALYADPMRNLARPATRHAAQAEYVPKSPIIAVFAQVKRVGCGVCKTVGSAYVGSNPTPATTCENGPLAGNSRLRGPFPLCPGMCHLVALRTAVSRCPRTYSGRRRCPGTVGAHRRLFHGRPRTGRASGVFRLDRRRLVGLVGASAIALMACRPSAIRAGTVCPCPLGTPGLMSFRTQPSWRRPAPHGATSVP